MRVKIATEDKRKDGTNEGSKEESKLVKQGRQAKKKKTKG